MVIPAIALKAFAVVVAGGAVAAIAVPAVSSANNYNWPILKNFHENYQGERREKCRWLAKDESSIESKKFLFVCKGEDGYEPNFYFYSESQNPFLVSEISKFEEGGGEEEKRVKVTVTLVGDSSSSQEQITISSQVWDVLQKKNSDSNQCSLPNSEYGWRSWTLQCGTGGGKGIPLTPMAW